MKKINGGTIEKIIFDAENYSREEIENYIRENGHEPEEILKEAKDMVDRIEAKYRIEKGNRIQEEYNKTKKRINIDDIEIDNTLCVEDKEMLFAYRKNIDISENKKDAIRDGKKLKIINKINSSNDRKH